MIKLSKYLVLIAGLMGVAAMFHPFVSGTTKEGQSVDMSAWSLLTDTARAGEKAAAATDGIALATAHVEAMPGMLWIPVLLPVFLAALLLSLLGTWGVLRARFGRLFGLLASLAGLFVLGFAVILTVSMAGDELASTGLGGKLLLGAGLLACVGGFVAVVKPDRHRRPEQVTA